MQFFVQMDSGSIYLISTDTQYRWVIKTHNGDRPITGTSDPERDEFTPVAKIRNPHQFQYQHIHYLKEEDSEVAPGITSRVAQLIILPDPAESKKDNQHA